MQAGHAGKLWGGRFVQGTDSRMERFHNIAGTTGWLLEADIRGSVAHARMLAKCGLITPGQAADILRGLEGMLEEARGGTLVPDNSFEDVHSFVEVTLTARIGEAGKVLHTARSRNDQVNTDMKLYARESCGELARLLQTLLDTLKAKADAHPVPMPGYTHLQRAQAVTFKHWLMAYHGMFSRDLRRVGDAVRGMGESPLGCGALAGTTHDIDRAYTAALLGFDKPYDNFLDGVSDRDYLIEALAALSLIMMHLSRLSEELVLFSSKEFGFIELDERFTTGSSIMPQKRNPDSAELIRGKAGRVYGCLMALLTVMKGLPLAYNKDMQEDKAAFYNAMSAAQGSLAVMDGVIATLVPQEGRMRQALRGGFMNATEAADYLVRKGVPFRDAHGVIGSLVLYAEGQGKELDELTLDEFRRFSPAFDETVYGDIDCEQSLRTGIKKEML
ncbi:MAG TPA: argininosuccinate lyase [Candidatus Limnocylindria bacterium]|nr:argininosuccinate lyase [Candidatus Limnocylindria bacterium]